MRGNPQPLRWCRVCIIVVWCCLYALPASSLVVHARTVCVRPGGGGGCYATIASAIAATLTGDTITVAAGTYNEHDLTIEHSLTIVGENMATTIVDARSLGRGFIADKSAQLQNLTIRGGKVTTGNGGAILNNAIDGLTLLNCTVINNQAGMLVTSGTVPPSTGRGGGIANAAGATLTLNGVSVTKNRVIGNSLGNSSSLTSVTGGGVDNAGHLTVIASTINGNQVTGGTYPTGTQPGANVGGGGIYNAPGATLSVTTSTLDGNSVKGGTTGVPDSVSGLALGGGIANEGSTTITASTMNQNDALGGDQIRGATWNTPANGLGGGIFTDSDLSITNSTIYGNFAIEGNGAAGAGGDGRGGGIYIGAGVISLSNSTIAANRAANIPGGVSYGGGIWAGSFFTLTDSIVASNTLSPSVAANGLDIKVGGGSAGLMSGGYNLIGDATGVSGLGPTDLHDVPPGLASALANNGGPTLTLALLDGSNARDRIPATGAGCPATDQRGDSRPRPTGGLCDIGAFER